MSEFKMGMRLFEKNNETYISKASILLMLYKVKELYQKDVGSDDPGGYYEFAAGVIARIIEDIEKVEGEVK